MKLEAIGGPGCGEVIPIKKRPEAVVRLPEGGWQLPQDCTDGQIQEGHFYLCVDDKKGKPCLVSELLDWTDA